MAWRGSLARSISARSASLLSPPAIPRARPPRISSPRRRLPFPSSRVGLMGELGCVQSMLPLHSVVAAARLTSHLSVSVRACCELSQGKGGKDG